jgi:glycosyltransferase involved in cell wall biosynthesis
MQNRPTRTVAESTFIVLANGAGPAPPASGLIDYLVTRKAKQVTVVFHPLTAEDASRHIITTYIPKRSPRTRTVRLPSHPPYTFPLDLLVPPQLPRVSAWFAFNNLLCARGLLARSARRAGTVVYWAVDFVPDRFGAHRPLTRVYDLLDAYCCRQADLRIELSQAALEGRNARHEIAPGAGAPHLIAPVGAWLDHVAVTPEDGWKSRRIAFVAHLVERMGGDTLIQAMALLADRGVEVVADIAGRGPLENTLRAEAARRGLQNRVRFHGFISDPRKLECLLSQAAIGLAPYSTRLDSFTRYADPSKLKSYLAAGLPILMTDVPPNARALARDAGAQVLPDDPMAFADAIERTLADAIAWRRRRAAALRYALQFDWNTIVGNVLQTAGFDS